MKKILLWVVLLLMLSTNAQGQTRPDWLQLRNRPSLDIRDFGAKPGANIRGALILAVAAATPSGVIVIPTGSWVFSGGAVKLPPGVEIRGAGRAQTVVNVSDNLGFLDVPGSWFGIEIGGLQVIGVGTGAAISDSTETTHGMNYSLISDLEILNFHTGLSLPSAWEGRLSNIRVASCTIGLSVKRAYAFSVSGSTFTDCATAIRGVSGPVSILGCDINGGNTGIEWNYASGLSIAGLYTEDTQYALSFVANDSVGVALSGSYIGLSKPNAVGIHVASAASVMGNFNSTVFDIIGSDVYQIKLETVGPKINRMNLVALTNRSSGGNVLSNQLLRADVQSNTISGYSHAWEDTPPFFESYRFRSPAKNQVFNVAINATEVFLDAEVFASSAYSVFAPDVGMFRGVVELITEDVGMATYWVDGRQATPSITLISTAPVTASFSRDLSYGVANEIALGVVSNQIRVRNKYYDSKRIFIRAYNQGD
jgi:hypothetical protein